MYKILTIAARKYFIENFKESCQWSVVEGKKGDMYIKRSNGVIDLSFIDIAVYFSNYGGIVQNIFDIYGAENLPSVRVSFTTDNGYSRFYYIAVNDSNTWSNILPINNTSFCTLLFDPVTFIEQNKTCINKNGQFKSLFDNLELGIKQETYNGHLKWFLVKQLENIVLVDDVLGIIIQDYVYCLID